MDFKGIAYQAEAVLPGFHMFSVKRIAPGTSVPVLIHDDVVIQGSDSIIDYLDERYPQRLLTPQDPDALDECRAIEQKADRMIGVNLRRILYHRLLQYPKLIKHYFMQRSPVYQGFIFSLFYPVLKRKIRQKYVITEERVHSSMVELNQALDWFDERLATKDFLVGNGFTRADLSVAAMLSIVCCPPEHPVTWVEQTPDPETNALMRNYKNRRTVQWALSLYRDYRA